MKVRYTNRAKDELEISFVWYEGQRRGLGFEFLDCVEVTIEAILYRPKMYAECHQNFRRALIRRFPFSVFYTIEKSAVVIHAIFDNRQDPIKLPE